MLRFSKILGVLVAVAAIALPIAWAPSASADTVVKAGTVNGQFYRSVTNHAAGAAAFQVTLEVGKDPAGDVISVSGSASILKLTKAALRHRLRTALTV